MAIIANKMDEIVLRVERAIAELRAGRPVLITHESWGVMLFRAAECAWQGVTEFEELLTEKNEDALVLKALEEVPEQGRHIAENELDHAVLQCLKHARLLPVALVSEAVGADVWLHLSAEDVEAYHIALEQTVVEVASAALPTKWTDDMGVRVFRSRFSGTEHLALIVGDIAAAEAPLVRVHSSCLTGDLLGSLRCDCGDQLQKSLQMMTDAGGGVLCYLDQEGRGIGIANKIRAYALQEQGEDTLQANETLGYGADERRFGVVKEILKNLKVSKLKLLTNNPEKVKSLEELGFTVTERVPLQVEASEHNKCYLQTKAERFGHWL